jgi:hypothetical protein
MHTIISIWPIDSAEFRKQVVAAVGYGRTAIFARVSHPTERSGMLMERRVNDLIAAGWRALGTDSGPVGAQHWRRNVFDYMNGVYGPDHVYTVHFQDCVRQGEKRRRKNDGISYAHEIE